MGEITRIDGTESPSEGHEVIPHQADLIEVTNGILMDTRSELPAKASFSMPIAQLATLGAGVSSLIPALHTVTQTTTVNTQGLYYLANAGVGDALKVARNGNSWGALKCADGTSKMAQFQSAGPLTATSTATVPIDPATMLMAVALFSIEQKLDSIEEMQKQILTFLEVEKESEIEADVETLVSMISKFKYNWDNEHYLQSNHKMVLDLQRTARKNMLSYQKQVTEVLNSKQLVVAQMKVKSTLKDLLKKFKYNVLTKNTYSRTVMKEAHVAAMEEFIDNVRVLINALGYKVLEPTVQKTSDSADEDEKLYLNTGAVRAVGIVTSEGFVLLAGSKINEKASEKSLNKGAIALRKKHFAAGRVKDLTTTEDILFSSSSAAADFVTGYSVSGPASWKNAAGQTLKEIESK